MMAVVVVAEVAVLVAMATEAMAVAVPYQYSLPHHQPKAIYGSHNSQIIISDKAVYATDRYNRCPITVNWINDLQKFW